MRYNYSIAHRNCQIANLRFGYDSERFAEKRDFSLIARDFTSQGPAFDAVAWAKHPTLGTRNLCWPKMLIRARSVCNHLVLCYNHGLQTVTGKAGHELILSL